MRQIFVPSRTVALPGGLVAPPVEQKLTTWHAHLLKHPLGVHAVRGNQPWNQEGWDRTVPPVVTAEQRERIAGRIMALRPNGMRCQVRELRGARSPEAEPCYACQTPLVSLCAAILDEADGVGHRYAATIEALLTDVAEEAAVVIPRRDLSFRLIKSLTRPAWIEAGTVLAVGVDGKTPMVRIARADGTRADFWLNGNGLTWRTTYRMPQASVHTQLSFMMDHFAPAPSLPLSDVYVVPRRWWEAYGI
ncbi:hypothetical protein AB3662_11375 [Sorangium cellulosum]|uniref:hypothetical protein n=1 Tax=Sorangium cellulosum TaxID=56 RepID=UPI003D9A30A7